MKNSILYDLSGGVVMKADSRLGLLNFFVELQSPKENEAEHLIECDLISQDQVHLKYKNNIYKYRQNNWVAQLFQLLPVIYMDALPNFVFLHGSCFCVNDNIVMLLGHSRSGKSTTMYNFLLNHAVKYVSDEIIAIEPIKKYILPLSNKPIQLREDVVTFKDCTLVDDAWNMNKVTYICPQIKETACLPFSKYRLTYCFIKYNKNCDFKIKTMSGYELINSLLHCCFNISSTNHNLPALIEGENTKAIRVEYDGNIEKLYEVIS